MTESTGEVLDKRERQANEVRDSLELGYCSLNQRSWRRSREPGARTLQLKIDWELVRVSLVETTYDMPLRYLEPKVGYACAGRFGE